MKKSYRSSSTILILLESIAIISSSYYALNEAMAFPHASIIIESEEEHANPIELVLGHTNEPAFGKLPGIHDGKHYLEVELSDKATTLPIPNSTLFADKYYFRDIPSFENAQSLEDADAIERNVLLTPVFGQPGLFYNRQVVDEGIYGYTIRGAINYYSVALVPIEPTTIFCSIEEGDASRFNSEGWTGSFGCPENIKDIFFPRDSKKPNYNNSGGYENPKEQYQS